MTIKQQQRAAAGHIAQYLRSAAYSLDDVYGRYSAEKCRAWSYCIGLMRDLKGSGLKVISHTYSIFTAGFIFSDPETGVLKMMYITPSYDRSAEIPADLL